MLIRLICLLMVQVLGWLALLARSDAAKEDRGRHVRAGRGRRPRPGRPGPAAGTCGGTPGRAGAIGHRAGHVARRVLRICCLDRDGNHTGRDVESAVFLAGPRGWYLVGWCRVRDAARCFRVDRIRRAEVTGVTAAPRALEEIAPCVPDLLARTPVL